MGMYSWCCKGCGYELKQGEYVRLNGCVGEYSGYGSAGGFNYSDCWQDPTAWHEYCYQQAPPMLKLDEQPSRSAPGQGFGYPALLFRRKFDPKAPITFFNVVHADALTEDMEHTDFRASFYVVGGKWVDSEEYRKRYDKLVESDPFWDEVFGTPQWDKLSDGERNAEWDSLQSRTDNRLGMRNPLKFHEVEDDFTACWGRAQELLPALPVPPKRGNWDHVIYGKQEQVEGAYYVATHYWPYDYDKKVHSDEPEDTLEYMHGVPAADLKKVVFQKEEHEDPNRFD